MFGPYWNLLDHAPNVYTLWKASIWVSDVNKWLAAKGIDTCESNNKLGSAAVPIAFDKLLLERLISPRWWVVAIDVEGTRQCGGEICSNLKYWETICQTSLVCACEGETQALTHTPKGLAPMHLTETRCSIYIHPCALLSKESIICGVTSARVYSASLKSATWFALCLGRQTFASLRSEPLDFMGDKITLRWLFGTSSEKVALRLTFLWRCGEHKSCEKPILNWKR